MDRRALLISIVATVAGVGLLRLYMHRFELEATGGPPTQVLMLVKDAPAGTLITRELLGSRGLPQAYLESRHIPARDIDQVLDGRLGVPGRANEALLWSDLASMRAKARQLSNLVPEGMRAFTLEVRDAAFDALLTPGDRVDVLLAASRSERERLDVSAAIVAQSLLVLAVGDDLGGTDPRRERHAGRAGRVTLAVTPAEGAHLAQVERQGALRLVVRNPDDTSVTDLTQTRPSDGASRGEAPTTLGED